MRLVLKIIGESAILALGQLSGNKLRSFLSLLAGLILFKNGGNISNDPTLLLKTMNS